MLTFDIDIADKTKVLLIEDNQADARLLEIYLNESDVINCEITHCVRLGDAFDLLNTNQKFDAIFLDLTLPDSTGLETLDRLMAHSPSSNVLVMTGLSDRTLGVNAVRSGAQDYIIKGSYDAKSLGKALVYSIERASVKEKLEETQRLAKIGNWEYDINEKSLYASREVFRILNLDQRGLKLKYDNFDEKLKRFIHFITRKTPKTGKIERNVEIKFDEEGDKYIFISAERYSEFHGEEKIRGIIQDITSKRKSEQLERQQALTLKATEMKEQFIASVSHEMRTPMNAILGMSNLALQTNLNTEQSEYIKAIKQSSTMLLGIVNDILEFSSIQNGEIQFENKRFNLKDLLNNMVDVMKYKIKEKNLKLIIDPSDSVPEIIKGDQQRLNQILFNLVGNAIKFTKDGFIKVSINVINETENNIQLRFEISDTGIGIPQDKVDAIFGSFIRVENKDELFEGTGLGLAISKNYVELQGGLIGASSKLGEGSTFYFELNFDKPKYLNKDETQKTFDTSIESLKILLVEDNKLNQIVAQKTLEKKWHDKVEITIANNGREGIDAILKDDYDIILMDIQMPILDGYEALAEIRSHPIEKIKDLPVLAMTAHANIAREERFHTSGFNDFVLKPFDPQNLFEKIVAYRKHNKKDLTTNTAPIKIEVNMEYKPNFEYLETVTMGDLEMKNEVISMLLSDIPQSLAELKACINLKDWGNAFQASHKFKSTLAYTGSLLLIETNKDIEDITRNDKSKESIESLVSLLDEYCPKVVELLEQEISK